MIQKDLDFHFRPETLVKAALKTDSVTPFFILGIKYFA